MENDYIRTDKRNRSLTLAATGLGFVVVLLDVSVVNVALERFRAAFGAGVSDLQWVVNAYTVTFAALLLTAGALGDRYGTRRVFVAGFAIFTAASLACGLSVSLATMLIARVVQGFGAAMLVPASLSLVHKSFADDPAARSRAVGIWAGSGGIALAAGPVVGGLLILHFGWRSIFLMNLPLGLIGITLTMRYAPKIPPSAGRSLDLAGQLSAIVALGTLTAGLIEAGPLGWGNPIVYGSIIACLFSVALFIRIESQGRDPMLPLDLFLNPTFSTSSVVGVLVNSAFYGFVFVLSLFFQGVQGYSPVQTGLAFLPMTAVLTVGNIIAGRLMAIRGPRMLVIAGQALAAIGYLSMLRVGADSSYIEIAIPMLLAGSGIALTVPPMTNASLSVVGPAKAGIASAVLNSARQVGGVLGVSLFGFLVRGATESAFMAGMRTSLIIAAGSLFAGSLASKVWVARPTRQAVAPVAVTPPVD